VTRQRSCTRSTGRIRLFIDLIANMGLIGFLFIFVGPNKEDNSRVKECTNISKKTSISSKHKLELWSKEHKKTEFLLTSQH